jgi:hypothetical protein
MEFPVELADVTRLKGGMEKLCAVLKLKQRQSKDVREINSAVLTFPDNRTKSRFKGGLLQ